MEKFAVDLEKVLDEFEYNEEREENVSVPSARNQTLPALGIGPLRQVSAVRPPAVNYRRPSFEPINLADADFAASPPKPSTLNFNLGTSGSGKQNEDETFGLIGNNAQLNNIDYVNTDNGFVSTLKNDVNMKNLLVSESEDETANVWPNSHTSKANDEKPDLLEYNSKNFDFDTDNINIHKQLPDITTSVRSLDYDSNSNEDESIQSSLDLISSTSGLVAAENCVVTQKTCNDKTDGRDSFSEAGENISQTYNQSVEIHYSHEIVEEPKKCVEGTGLGLSVGDSSDIGHDYPDIPLNLSSEEVINNVCVKSGLNNIIDMHNEEVQKQPVFFCDDVCVPVEGNSLKETSGEMCDSKSVQPIGFTNDSDVSDGELEEYLKELEEMDNDINFKEDVLLGEKTVEIGSNNIKSSTGMSGSTELEEKSFSNETATSTCNVNKSASVIEEDEPRNNTTKCDRTYDVEVINENNQILENISVKCESPISHSQELDTSLSSTPQTSENEMTSEETDLIHSEEIVIDMIDSDKFDSKLVESKVPSDSGIGDENRSGEIITNPFENTSISNKRGTKDTVSTNPFDDEDSGYVSEKLETRRKSTNPFYEDGDEDISLENSLSESLVPAKPTESLTQTLSKSKSKKSIEDKIDKANLKSDNSASLSDREPSRQYQDKIVEGTVSKNSLKSIQDTTVVTSVIEENSANESLPSCSKGNGDQEASPELETSAKMIPIKAAVESPSTENVDEAGVMAEEDRPPRPNSLELTKKITVEATVPQSSPPQSPPQSPNAGQLAREFGPEDRRLGKIPPFWVPDTDAASCMQCQQKFTVIKRRHHCRACGQVLCNKCCGLKARLEYMNFTEARVCQPCFTILEALNEYGAASPLGRQPNPNNPMEYCSTIPPLQQAAGSLHQPPPSVMVPVGVLKREGRMKSEVTKQVMFSDGIRPGGDLTELDGSCEPRIPFRRPGRLTKRVGTPPGGVMSPSMRRVLDPTTHSFIPSEGESSLPPVTTRSQGEVTFTDLESPIALNSPEIKFALNRNLFVTVKRVNLDCCVNRECWCFSTEGLACVGQDEIVFLLECLPQETLPPKDIFLLINYLYQEAAKGSTVSEMSFTPATSNNLLGSKDHGGFLYIRTSFQCTAQLVLPSPPYLVALLIHRWETPWARLFPLRLVLRLGAEFRYYPCPLVSVRNRPPLYTDIGHTIINILADFRKYSYTLPSVRGLVIHMEDRQTTINIPRNRYDQVVRALNNSNDSVLAFGANMSLAADSHLVCMQSREDENTAYSTQAINIHNKPRRVTGASFVVFNGALKVPGLAGKSSIVEDGLMVQVPSETMTALRTALRDMRDYTVGCGPNAEETVALVWTADDINFNIGVKSCIDGRPLDGVPSIRVHNGTDYSGGTRIIRWTEVFILQCEDSEHSSEPLDISRLSESIARATCLALVPMLDLLSAATLSTLAVRTTIHPDNVGYEAGSNGEKLPPLYMKSLDDELIAVVHQAALASQDNPCVLELVFRIMEQG